MGRQIIKQPNGLYAVFSSVVDHFVMYDCTVQDLIEEQVREATEEIEKAVRRTIAELDKGGRPYHQFTMAWDEAVDFIREVHGDDENTEDIDELDKVISAATTTPDASGKGGE